MPFKSEKLPLGKYDRRVKLNDVQRDEIKELRKQGLSYAKIAKQYEVSKKMVIMVCNPDIAERNRLAFIERSREVDTKQIEKIGLQQCENIEYINKNFIRKVKYNKRRFIAEKLHSFKKMILLNNFIW